MVVCEWCGQDKKRKSIYKIAGHKICKQCNRRKKDNLAPKIKKFFTWSPIKKERVNLKREEKEVLDDKYTKQKLTEKEKDSRLSTLSTTVKQNKVRKTKSKPDFKKGFTELSRRKKE